MPAAVVRDIRLCHSINRKFMDRFIAHQTDEDIIILESMIRELIEVESDNPF